MKKDSKILSFFVGILALIVIVFFYGLFTSFDGFGAVQSFFGFAAISIICTAGISLVIWVPVLLLLGTAVTKIFHLFFGKKTQQTLSSNTNQSVGASSSNNELAIIGYIVSSRNSGVANDTVIRSNLKSGGWSDVDIDNAFKKCVPQT